MYIYAYNIPLLKSSSALLIPVDTMTGSSLSVALHSTVTDTFVAIPALFLKT